MSRTPPLHAAPTELRQIETNGIRANVALAGSGPAVVLLHGFPHTWRLWSEIIGPLSAQYRVIAPDLRGFGATSRASDGYDAGTLAADVAGILDALGEPTAAVVAIDAGTPVAVLVPARPGQGRGEPLAQAGARASADRYRELAGGGDPL
ncbi:alpha/beta fold hydrolase, partial [Nocardia sp. NPDC060220]|uniref:alpha/beta fold hydrolase n=1 Tax=Nocardia sp. NPDC060220 TaxID=3347076 RepID=UPI0036605E56